MNNDFIEVLSAQLGNRRTARGDEPANPVMDALSERLLKQSSGISSSSSSQLRDTINEAISGVQASGDATTARLQSERQREVDFARDRANTTYTTALEGRSGYATQVAALRELTETTEKSIRDLDKRYQESILANDAATASQIAELRIKKLEFQLEQEQNFFSNLISVGNLQEQALSRQQQNEQFWFEKEQQDEQFIAGLVQSQYQFEKNYGLSLRDMGIKEQQLEIDRERFNLSLREYNDRKKALTEEKGSVETRAIVSNTLRNNMKDDAGNVLTKEQLLSTEMMLKVKEETGFEGSSNDLAKLINDAYEDMTNDPSFVREFVPAPTKRGYTSNPTVNKQIQAANNKAKVEYDRARDVTIQSPESFWGNLFN